MKNRNIAHSDNWATPPAFLADLEKEFGKMFDPCPFSLTGEIDFDGLEIEWESVNYINPPYSQKLKEQFVIKAIAESKKGKTCVVLLPVSTSTKLFHDHIQPNINEIRFLKGRLSFIGVNTKGEYVNWHLLNYNGAPPSATHVKNSGMHDSMLVIFKPETP